MRTQENRLDPSVLTARQLRQLDRLSEAVADAEQLAFVGKEGAILELPEPIFHMLVNVVRTMREGKSVVLLPENESMTTQSAAETLGVSRPFFVGLLEKKAIPYHKVGAHRRVYMKDLIEYQRKRDTGRRAILDDLRGKVDAAGLYESGVVGDSER
jgi:excisionase family DNA binding protein